MNKKYFRMLITLFLMIAILAACAPKPTEVVPPPVETAAPTEVPVVTEEPVVLTDRQKTVIFDIDGGSVADPQLWNPFAGSARLDQGLMQAMAEPLFILNLASPDLEIVNWLGESMDVNEDGTVWTIKLRPNITWSDGTPLTADDFLFTVELGRNTADLSNMPNFSKVADVQKLDDLTLQFTLTEGDFRFGINSFVGRTATPFFIVPKHIWEGQDPITFTNYDAAKGWPVFSGPYLLASASETEFNYVRNENWWGAATGTFNMPKPEKLSWIAYGTLETRVAAMSKGDLDSLMGIDVGSFLALQKLNPNVVAWTADLPYAWAGDPCTRSLNFNMTVKPWDDPEMRKAVNYAIDRSMIIDIAYGGTTTAANTFLPDELFKPYISAAEAAGLFADYPVDNYDPAAAKAALEAKGYTLNSNGYYEKDGQELSLKIANFDDTEFNNATAAIVEQLQAVGINASEDIQPIPTFIDNLTNAKFEGYYFFICGPVDLWAKMDSFNVRHIPAEGESSSGFYANTERWNSDVAVAYSEVVDRMRNLPPTSPQLVDLYVEAMNLWYQEMPALPIVQSAKLTPFDTTNWTNWPTADNPFAAPATWWPSTLILLTQLERAGQ